jgi:NAD-dependent SIR2 family protein deacetylase
MAAQAETWCDRDEHKLFELFVDFNEWLESDEGIELRQENNIDELAQPSKALFAGDKEAYDQAFEEYRTARRNETLNKEYLCEQFTDDHWFQRNLDHFDQLVRCLETGAVVPFIGAGLSVAGGFPSWKDHLRQQGRTAGIDKIHIEDLLGNGQYETVIEEIENIRGRDVLTQKIRDVFSRAGNITNTTLLLTELFSDTVITTNYDRLIEQAFDTGQENAFQVINGLNALEKPESDRVTIIKLHGDIKNPTRCILSKNQYDAAYGGDQLDMTLPIPKLLSYYYKNSSLLFLGCSLNNDRTIQVFRAAKVAIGDAATQQHFSIEQAPEDGQEIVARNAHLANLGITAIWFEKGSFDYVDSILRLAKNELRYMGAMPGAKKEPIVDEPMIISKRHGLFGKILKRILKQSVTVPIN